MSKVFVTGMAGTGKSSALAELARRHCTAAAPAFDRHSRTLAHDDLVALALLQGSTLRAAL